jgi:hypothetical protein
MATDLAVDTSLIRLAAQAVDEAAAAFDGGAACAVFRCPLVDGSLGSSALAREVAGAAARRVQQAIDATQLLARTASATAADLRAVASTFEAAEASGFGPR